ncbi:unnamed protein product [Rotaria sp. Silwood2]|nr:unnamed protein product [Rotaria sp. Silwood2]CAF2835890.1 unnamed protein product [Rotaria sp. Silwood2]CAF3133053.1 unnamed protein product [Rotaria sp. Silwood2]CAF3357215.1 unnamed protein product [Rotaria sp. Silwood2]CAF4040117.1 unnamed protein product [Rotaria sp. Silwood2]
MLQQKSSSITSLKNNQKEKTSLAKEQVSDKLFQSSSYSFTCNDFDIEKVKFEQSKDPSIKNKIKETQQHSTNNSYILHDGLLYKLISMHSRHATKTKLLYLPSSMINSLLKACYSDPLGGHFGIQRTYLKLKNKFWWPGMKHTITQYIKSCLPCQQHNISRIKTPGQLYPIETPEGPFQLIDIDFCGPFKCTPRGNQYVLCITDYFTRWINAVALPDCSDQTTAQTIFNEYICRYGVPISILPDQGTHFRNQLMNAMEKLIGYNHIFSTVYHPQSNGMVERCNATFVPQLAKLHDRENNNWGEYLLPVVFAYNTGVHSTTQYSPFQLQFGWEPRLPTDKPPTNYVFHKPIEYYTQLKRSLKIIHQDTLDNIIHKQSKYKKHYDKNRCDPMYQLNDQVLIKCHGSRSKLDPRYSLTPKVIIKKQHSHYWVKDETTQLIARVHVNDIRPILVL